MSSETVVIDGELNLLNVFLGGLDVLLPADSMAYETGTYTTVSARPGAVISFRHEHTTAPIFVLFMDATGTYLSTGQTNFVWAYIANSSFAAPLYSSANVKYDKIIFDMFRHADNAVLTSTFTINGSVTNTGFTAGYSNMQWRQNRTYRWIAIWKAGQS